MSDGARNVDAAEVSRFDDMAAHWWDPRGDCKPLHDLNPARLGFIEKHTGLHGARVADVGCGGGILAESLATAGAEVVAIDAAETPLEVARLHQLESGTRIDYRLCTAEELATAEASGFDVVTCMELIEHVPQPDSLVRACAALVKPRGLVFFSTINRTPKSYAFAILGAEYLLRLLPRGTHDYRRFVRPSELAESARHSGLSLVELTGLRYNPLTGGASLMRDVDVNYLVCFRRDD